LGEASYNVVALSYIIPVCFLAVEAELRMIIDVSFYRIINKAYEHEDSVWLDSMIFLCVHVPVLLFSLAIVILRVVSFTTPDMKVVCKDYPAANIWDHFPMRLRVLT